MDAIQSSYANFFVPERILARMQEKDSDEIFSDAIQSEQEVLKQQKKAAEMDNLIRISKLQGTENKQTFINALYASRKQKKMTEQEMLRQRQTQFELARKYKDSVFKHQMKDKMRKFLLEQEKQRVARLKAKK